MGIPENVVKAMPTERVHERSHLLQHGEQCRLCLRTYQIGERVRRLPCRHKFHIDCIGNYKSSYHGRINFALFVSRWMAFT
jgi:E3 ubiquitin-protein ligase ZSWIM2